MPHVHYHIIQVIVKVAVSCLCFCGYYLLVIKQYKLVGYYTGSFLIDY